MTIKNSNELDLSKPLTVIFACADRKNELEKQLNDIRAAATEQGYEVIEEFGALTFPKESNREKVFLEAFTYLFNNHNIVQTLFLISEYVLPETTLSESLLSLARNQLGVDVLYAREEF